MNYPKYIEFQNGDVVIFSSIITHTEMAAWAALEPISAGFICFPTADEPHYTFFGDSKSLNLKSQTVTGMDTASFFGGVQPGYLKCLVISTSQTLIEKLCESVAELQIATLEDECGNQLRLPLIPNVQIRDIARFTGYFSDPHETRLLSN